VNIQNDALNIKPRLTLRLFNQTCKCSKRRFQHETLLNLLFKLVCEHSKRRVERHHHHHHHHHHLCSVLDEPMEESIMDPRIHAETAEEDVPHVVTYQLVEAGTKRARTKLVDSDGHTYNVQLRRANATYWQCTVRGKGNYCKAIVIQRGDGFQQGKQEHNHPPAVGAANAARIMAVKQLTVSSNQHQRSSTK